MGLLDQAVKAEFLSTKVKGLFYGPAGTRKTSFVKDAPSPFWWDFERSADSLKFYPEAKDIPIFRVDRLNPTHTPKVILDGMMESLRDDRFQTIVFDTVDRMHSFFLKHHMERIETEKKTLVGDGVFTSRTRYLPQFQDHNLITNYLDDFFELAQACDKNIVFISHEVEQYSKPDDQGNQKFIGIRPGLTPQLSKKLRELVNVVAYFTVEKNIAGVEKQMIQLAPTADKIIAKNRLGIAKAKHENPTWDSLFNHKQESQSQPQSQGIKL